MYKQLALGTIGLLSLGCAQGPSDHYKVHISRDFSSDQIQQICDALMEWEAATQGPGSRGSVKFDVVVENYTCDAWHTWGYDICIQPTYQEELTKITGADGEIGATQWTSVAGYSTIHLLPLSEVIGHEHQYQYYRVTLHEIGHSLGLDHTQPGSVMCWEVPCEPQHLTCTDVGQYYSLRHDAVAPPCTSKGVP